MRHPRDIYDRPQDASDPDDNWVGGDIEVVEERPATALAGDPRQRKWMVIGVAACGLLTALALLLMTSGSSSVQADEQVVEAPAPVEQDAQLDAVAEAAAPVEPELASAKSPASDQASSKQAAPSEAKPATTTLAATSVASASPSASPSPSPTPSTPAPSTPPESKPTPAGAPALAPVDDKPASNSLSELPDVEPWDDADAALERDEPSDPGPAAANEPPDLDDPLRPTAEMLPATAMPTREVAREVALDLAPDL